MLLAGKILRDQLAVGAAKIVDRISQIFADVDLSVWVCFYISLSSYDV